MKYTTTIRSQFSHVFEQFSMTSLKLKFSKISNKTQETYNFKIWKYFLVFSFLLPKPIRFSPRNPAQSIPRQILL